MSEIEKLEAEYRSLATQLTYTSANSRLDKKAKAQLDELGERISRLNAADFLKDSEAAALPA